MNAPRPPFPESVRRPRRSRRRRRGGTVAAALAVAALALLLPRWTVRSVRLPGNAPAPIRANLTGLVGTPLPWAGLSWIRQQVEGWPGATAAEVLCGLDGTLVVRWTPCAVAGSVRTGAGWHGVCEDGTAGPRLNGPVAPVIGPPRGDPGTIRRVLRAARRLQENGLGPVARIRIVLPGEIEAWTGPPERRMRVLAALDGSPSETAARRLLAGPPVVGFLDVSRAGRIVAGPREEVGS